MRTAREYADEIWKTSELSDVSEFTISLESAISMMEGYSEEVLKNSENVEQQTDKPVGTLADTNRWGTSHC